MLRPALLTLLLIACVAALSSCSLHSSSQPLAPLDQQVVDTLRPGLLPRYFGDFNGRNVNELPDDDSTRAKSWLGEPIPQLHNRFGVGEVFGSGQRQTIGVRMRGFLYFPEPGTYTFQALSNDGVVISIGDTVVVDDPVQHSNQLSAKLTLEIPAAGCYPIRVDYFQRKGTAALELFWQPPGGTAMTIIPAGYYGHLPDSQ
ncbi:MAG: PA14 domain-containing protein [Desulfopila sp.]